MLSGNSTAVTSRPYVPSFTNAPVAASKDPLNALGLSGGRSVRSVEPVVKFAVMLELTPTYGGFS